MPNLEENKQLVRRMEDEIFNRRNLDAVDAFIAPDYTLRTAPPGAPAGRAAVREAIAAYLTGLPGLRVEVELLLAEDDTVAALLTYSGTHDGELFGVPATGRPVRARQIAIYRIDGGRIVDEWEVSDQLGLLQQIGAIPADG
jgi:steroid delta-isomerase-like uncharacterized protein